MRNKLLIILLFGGFALSPFTALGEEEKEATQQAETQTERESEEAEPKEEGEAAAEVSTVSSVGLSTSEEPEQESQTEQEEAEAAEESQEQEPIVEGLTTEEAAQIPMMDYSKQRKFIINNINVHGVQFLDTKNIIAVSGIKKGDEVYMPGDYIAQAIKNFWNRRYFSDVNIVGNVVGDSINLDIYFTERPMVYTWKFEGIRKGQAKDLEEKLELKPGHELSDFIINRHTNKIRDYFFEKGFRNVEVEPVIENNPNYSNAVTVTFVIDRNKKVKIGELDFEGNEAFKSKRLYRTLKGTHKKSWNIFRNSRLKDDKYEEDKENLIDFYNSKGYRNAMIVQDSIYDINDRRIGIKITVDEGNKYYFRDISWVGNSLFETDYLQQLLGIHPGDTYDKKTMHKRLGYGKEDDPEGASISSLYQNRGYLFFDVEPTETIIGKDSIDLELKIYEGKQARINEVTIRGNMRVNDEVIRRELQTHPGDLYDRSMIMNTIRLLAQMEHFNPEAIAPSPVPVSAELVDINWDIEEQASDKAEISGGWGAGMFVGSIGLELNNLSLRNFFKKGAWRPYPQGQSQQLRIRAQSNGSYYKAFSVSFTEPWVGGRKPNSLQISTHYSDETDAYYMWQKGNKHFRTLGVSVGLGRRLNWPDPYFTLYNEVSYQSYNMKDWDYFIIENGNSNILQFTTVFGRSSVDQPIFPRRGSDFSLSLTLTPPYSLFDNKEYDDSKRKAPMTENDRYRWIEFHKWKFKGEWYYPLTNNDNLVLMARAEMGYIGSYNKHKPSPFEGFDVGGDGMSGYNLYGVDVIGLRGYENSALTPTSSDTRYARAYNKYTVELRYPIILKPSSSIYALAFAEGGNAFESFSSFNPFKLKRSAGFGVRLFLPIVGMLGIDWGYGFDKPYGSNKRSGGQIHYMIGMQF